jgi:hypothetical protein
MLHAQATTLYHIQRDAIHLVATSYPDGASRWGQLDGILPLSLQEQACAVALDRASGRVDSWRREDGQRMDNADRSSFRQQTMALSELSGLRQAEADFKAAMKSERKVIAEGSLPAHIESASRLVEDARASYRLALAERHWLAWLGYTDADSYVIGLEWFNKTVRSLEAGKTSLSDRQKQRLQKNHVSYMEAWESLRLDGDDRPTQEVMASRLDKDVRTIRRWEDDFSKLALVTIPRT